MSFNLSKKELYSISIEGTDEILALYETIDSGRVITRMKIDTITGVPHPGIVIGVDKYGRVWVAHNHFKNRRPMFETFEVYADGEQCQYDNRRVAFNRMEIVMRTLHEVRKRIKYNKVTYNCQTFVNLIVLNEKKSESIDKLTDNVLLASLGLTALGLASRNSGVARMGVIAGIATLAIKELSR